MAYFIGTSGYFYRHWEKIFYPQKASLEYYARFFNSVELNVTFYRQPPENVFKGWYKKTPPDFRFILKGPRLITHVKRLQNIEAALDMFLQRADILKEKLLGVLWQLPPNLEYEPTRFKKFLQVLRRKKIKFYQSLEVRNKSWFNEEVYDALKENHIALCIADSPRYPQKEITTAAFIYLRFHGGKVLYGSNYSEKELKMWRDKIKKWQKDIATFMIFFNNDAQGFAVKNALRLKAMLNKQ